MDPLTHTLAGAALAETPLGRLGGLRRGLATGTLLVAANLPDLDGLCYFVGRDFALGHRRGWTHGAPTAIALSLLLFGLLLLWERRRSGRIPPPGPLLALCAVGVGSHPLLDWLNVYGVRLLAPFDWTWIYGDAVYIVDPWLWLVLGGAVFAIRCRTWRAAGLWCLLWLPAAALVVAGAPPTAGRIWLTGLGALTALVVVFHLRRRFPGERLAVGAVLTALVYIGAMVASNRAGEWLVRSTLEARGEGPLRGLMVGPEAADPFHRQVVAETPEGYRLGHIRWLETPRLVLDERLEPYPETSPAVEAALRAPAVAGFVEWMRFPTTRVETDPSGTTVHLIDLRYARRASGDFGTATVRLGPDLEPLPQPNQPPR